MFIPDSELFYRIRTKNVQKTFMNIFFEKSILFISTRRLDILCMCYVWGFNSLRFILKVMIPYLGLNKTVPVHKVASAREIVGELLLTEHVLRHKPLVVGILDEAQRQAVFTVDLWIEKFQFFDTTL